MNTPNIDEYCNQYWVLMVDSVKNGYPLPSINPYCWNDSIKPSPLALDVVNFINAYNNGTIGDSLKYSKNPIYFDFMNFQYIEETGGTIIK